MNRRRFIKITPLLIGISGCLTRENSDSLDQSTPRETSAPPAEFFIENIGAPEEAELTEPFDVSIRVRNRGGPGTLRSQLVADRGVGMSPRFDFSVSVDSGATETVTIPVRIPYTGEVSFHVANNEIATKVEIVPLRLDIGESFKIDNGLEFWVNEVLLVSDFQFYDSFLGKPETYTPSNGYQFAFTKVRCRNTGSQPARTPLIRFSSVIAGGEQSGYEVSPVIDGNNLRGDFEGDRLYESGDLVPGASVAGWVIYEIPDSVNKEEVEVVWAMGSNNEQVVTWRSG